MKFKDSDEESLAHSIYIKKYRSEKKTSDKPVGKTLSVINIPPYANQESLNRVFSIAGQVENVLLIDCYKNEHRTKYQVKSEYFNQEIPFKFQIAFIVYKKSESLDLIFRLNELPSLSTAQHPVPTGIEKWTAQYSKRSVNIDEMQKEIDEYMKHYDKIKEAEKTQEEGENDDGWVTVGKKGHNAGFKQKESVINRLEQKIQNQKKKAKSLTSFYTFEMRESKKQQLMELRKKFEDDKLKMNSMKQSRKFKPY